MIIANYQHQRAKPGLLLSYSFSLSRAVGNKERREDISTPPPNFGRSISTLIDIIGHLFCTLISENQGLEKLRSILNLRKISGPVHLIFFSVHLNFFFSLSPDFFSDLYHKLELELGKVHVI